MAFTITPTSGTAPFLLEASFSAKESFSSGLYSLETIALTAVGSCPSPPVSGSNISAISAGLLADGQYIIATASIPAGSCRVYNLVIREVSTGIIISQAPATINNV